MAGTDHYRLEYREKMVRFGSSARRWLTRHSIASLGVEVEMSKQEVERPWITDWAGKGFSLESVRAPALVVHEPSRSVCASPEAERLAHLLRLDDASVRALCAAAIAAPDGAAQRFRSNTRSLFDDCITFTRYRLGDEHILVLIDSSAAPRASAEDLHDQRLALVGRLMASICHELRNHLSVVRFAMDELNLRGGLIAAQELRNLATDATSATDRATSLIRTLIAFAREHKVQCTTVSVREVMQQVQSLLRTMVIGGGHTLEISIDADGDAVRGNPILIEQVLVNLVVNAIEASQRPTVVRVRSELGGQRCEASHPCAACAAKTVRVVVEDDGPGVPADLRGKLFEPFFSTKPGGSGIGLALSRQIARALGGDMWIDEARSQAGAAFVVALPAAEARSLVPCERLTAPIASR